MHYLNVLLVEDNTFTRTTVAASLESEGFCVVASVGTAREAMSTAALESIDCAVLDLHLGMGPSGIDVAYSLRKEDPDLGIVILTSYEDPRLLSADQRPLPENAAYAVKNDISSTAQLRELVEAACDLTEHVAGPVPGRVPLTDGQVEVLRLAAMGLTNAEIARRRVVTERSVETALARTARRLGLDPAPGENARSLLIQSYFSMIGGAPLRS